MVEDAVQDDGNVQLLGCLAQLSKVLLGAQNRIDLGVIGGVVAVVACGFENGVEVDGCKAQLGDARQVFLDTLERAAVKSQVLMEPSSARSYTGGSFQSSTMRR